MESAELWPWRDEARGSGDGGEFLMPSATLHWRQLADNLWTASTPAHDYMAIDLSATSSVPGYLWFLSRMTGCAPVLATRIGVRRSRTAASGPATCCETTDFRNARIHECVVFQRGTSDRSSPQTYRLMKARPSSVTSYSCWVGSPRWIIAGVGSTRFKCPSLTACARRISKPASTMKDLRSVSAISSNTRRSKSE